MQGANNGTINNTGSFLITREGSITQDNGNGAIFNNLPGGTLAKTAGSGTGTATVQWQLNNGGTVESDAGLLTFSEGSSVGGGSNGVFLSTAAAARVGFSGGTHLLNAGATFRGPGRGQVSSGLVRLLGATTAGQAAPAVPSGGFEVTASGSMDGAGSLSVVGGGGTFAWSGNGTIATTVSVGAGGALAIDTTNNPYLNGGAIYNAGNAVLTGSGGTLQGANNAVVVNRGVFLINRSGAILQHNGNNADFRNEGILSLLPTASTVTLSWAFSQTATGTLNLKIGGSNAIIPQFDRFQSSATMTLDGTLNLSLINSFVPTLNDVFAVLGYGSHTGTFAKVNVSGAYFSRSYNPNDFTLTALNAPTNLAEWRAAYFDPGSPDAADNADPDHDGITNLLEYATGGNPLNASTNPTTFSAPIGGFAYFTYTRSKIALNDLQFQVEYGDLAGAWSHIGVTENIDSDDGSTQHVTAKMPAVSASREFAHLLVTKP